MSDHSNDRIVVVVSSAQISWSVTIDLHAGTAAKGGGNTHRIPSRALTRLRAEARAAHALGDLLHREQFADGEVAFELTLGGETITLSYQTWGGDSYDRVRAIWKYACRVPRTRRAPRD